MDEKPNPYAEMLEPEEEPMFLSYERLGRMAIYDLCILFILSLLLGICFGVPIGLVLN